MSFQRIVVSVAILWTLTASLACPLPSAPESEDVSKPIIQRMNEKIPLFLGRPYAFGACGPKRFDCSGFVWRVMCESGIRIKRTTARKLFASLPKASEEERWRFGTIVFFNNIKHCGIVEDSTHFYHASPKRGTVRSPFNKFWRSKICGFKKVPGPRRDNAEEVARHNGASLEDC